MNPSTLIGLVASVALMAVILLFGSDKPGNFIDAPSLAIVLGGVASTAWQLGLSRLGVLAFGPLLEES